LVKIFRFWGRFRKWKWWPNDN